MASLSSISTQPVAFSSSSSCSRSAGDSQWESMASDTHRHTHTHTHSHTPDVVAAVRKGAEAGSEYLQELEERGHLGPVLLRLRSKQLCLLPVVSALDSVDSAQTFA